MAVSVCYRRVRAGTMSLNRYRKEEYLEAVPADGAPIISMGTSLPEKRPVVQNLPPILAEKPW
jgi:hypothetical protein